MSKTVIYSDNKFAREFGDELETSPNEGVFLTKLSVKSSGVTINHSVTSLETESEKRQTTDYSVTAQALVHPDMEAVLKRAACHLAILTEYVTIKRTQSIKFLNEVEEIPSEFEKFTVTGISISNHEGDSYGVVISGNRRLASGRVTNLVSELVKLNQDGYFYVTELNALMDDILDESMLYLSGKQGTPDQLTLDLEAA